MTPLQRAQRVEELAEKATPGPWSEHSLSVLIGDSLRSEDSDCQFCAETRTLAPALAADVVALTAENERIQHAHDNLSRELRRQREALEEYREQANRWMGEAARILLGPDPDPADESLVLPALARKVRGRLEALTDLLRDAYPMFSHVLLLRDRAVALGLVERKEQEP